MLQDKMIEIRRDVDATLIPSGAKVMIQANTLATVTQALGNAYTIYINGNLVRIAGSDGDALGLPILDELDVNNMAGTLEDKIWTQLKTCFDPEIPVNIVDLGLVYACTVKPLAEDEYRVEVVMTLTAPGCGMGPVLVNEMEEKIKKINGVKTVKVELVFDPPWDRSKISDEAKLQLGLL